MRAQYTHRLLHTHIIHTQVHTCTQAHSILNWPIKDSFSIFSMKKLPNYHLLKTNLNAYTTSVLYPIIPTYTNKNP